ncbi:hypothetical protein EWM64_g10025, partial [Hericium alpestre]
MSSKTKETQTLDPYVASASVQAGDETTQQKISDLHKIIHDAGTSMLTTRDSAGHLHSRAMTPATPFSDDQLGLFFIANTASGKIDELENDTNVNVSFYDNASTSWASYSGHAHIVDDRAVIKEHWSPAMAHFFRDLHDGVHTGDASDPRVIGIEVIPDDIHFFSAVPGVDETVHVAPGRLHTITTEE